jgi:hypothetical protein
MGPMRNVLQKNTTVDILVKVNLKRLTLVFIQLIFGLPAEFLARPG